MLAFTFHWFCETLYAHLKIPEIAMCDIINDVSLFDSYFSFMTHKIMGHTTISGICET